MFSAYNTKGELVATAMSVKKLSRYVGLTNDEIRRSLYLMKFVKGIGVIREREKDPDYVWMLVTKDEFELPVLVCDDCTELSVRSGYSLDVIHSTINHCKNNGYFCKFKKVYIGDV